MGANDAKVPTCDRPSGAVSSVNPFEVPTMRLPRVRFTVRRLMAAVAVVAILLAASLSIVRVIRLRRAAEMFLYPASYHKQHEAAYIIRARDKRTGQAVSQDEVNLLNREWRAYHAAHRRKY